MRCLKIAVWILAVIAVGVMLWRSPQYAYSAAQSFVLLLEQNL